MPSQYEHGPDFQTWNEAEISRLSSENEALRRALKLASDYWSDYHVPCVYEEWDNDCDLCPVIEAVRVALETSK